METINLGMMGGTQTPPPVTENEQAKENESTPPPASANTTQNSDDLLKVESSEFSLPDEYKAKPWANNIKSFNDLLNQFDNAQKLIGKKPTQEKPQSIDDYEIDGSFASEEEKKNFKQMLFDSDLSKDQAKKLIDNYGKLTKAYQEQAAIKSKQMDEDFEKDMRSKYGEKWAGIAAKGREVIDKNFASHKDALLGLSNAQLGVFAEVINQYETKIKEITKEDSSPLAGGQGTSGASSLEEIDKQIRDLRNSEAYNSTSIMFEDKRVETINKISELYKKRAELLSK